MTDDVLIPLDEVERVYALVPGPKEKLVFQGVHNDIYGEDLLPTVIKQTIMALERLTSEPQREKR